MFLDALNNDEKSCFWQAVLLLVEVDQELHRTEEDIKNRLALELQLDDPPSAGTLEELLPSLKTVRRPVEANVFLFELAGVALADHELHPAEASLLEQFRAELEIPEGLLEQFYEVAEASLQVTERARLLINESGRE